MTLTDEMKAGLDAPICLTWELTYACNLQCVHCLSSSGRRDRRELTTAEAEAVIDEIQRMQVFYVNIGGGEPTIRPDFWHLVDYCVSHDVGVKFSTNGSRIDSAVAARLAQSEYVDLQISIDGADAATNDRVRGEGSFDIAVQALDHLAQAEFEDPKISVVMTRHNISQLDDLAALADRYGAQLRLTRFRPSGRGVQTWEELRPTAQQQRDLYRWLLDRPDTLTGDSFFHLSALGDPLPGLNLCGAGRVVCLIDPIGDIYACPFVLHDDFKAGNVGDDGGFRRVWRESELFVGLRGPQSEGACSQCGEFDACQGGCMATKFFTGMAIDGPDPDCVNGYVDEADKGSLETRPKVGTDHSRPIPVKLVSGPRRA